jgi:sigma-B regulation protein RsbU (phosphoserine phosphatase)
VGELSVADGKPISAWVVAGTDCKVLVIPAPVFVDQVLAVPAIARNLVVILSDRMRRSNLQIVARTRAAVELEALQRELAVAREIQASMLPAAPLFPPQAGIKGRGYMRAAQQVGGDFYDAFLLSDGRAFLAIGDVCNKGTPAALFMVRTLTILRSEASAVEPDPERHLARLAARCNDLLTQSNEAQQFVTVFCAIVDPKSRTMHYVNMGHCPALVRTPGSGVEALCAPRNPLAGIVPGLAYAVGRMALAAGSLVVLYTDGVTEAENPAGALFDEPPLLDAIAALPDTDVDACVERIVAAVDGFSAGHTQSDDITLLAFTLE